MSSLPDPALLARRDAEDGVEHVLVGAVLDCDGQILVLHRQDSGSEWWELPCGPVTPGEDLLAALGRVVAEETGLSLGQGSGKVTLMLVIRRIVVQHGQSPQQWTETVHAHRRKRFLAAHL